MTHITPRILKVESPGWAPAERGIRWKDSMHRSSMCRMRYSSLRVQSPPEVDRIWGIWGSYYNTSEAIFYAIGCRVLGLEVLGF